MASHLVSCRCHKAWRGRPLADDEATKTAGPTASEVLFYHLEDHPLERVLPSLLEKTVERGWRAVVKAGSAERLEALDAHLWTYRDDSFLAHGVAGEAHAERQPVLLTCDHDVPNDAGVMFLVDGARCAAFRGFSRIVYLFDGHDREAVSIAREEWTRAKDAECACTYWQQNADGRWRKKA